MPLHIPATHRSVVERYNFFAMTTPGALILLSM
jgi:hypothetical protein